ncbi:hypothetical protein C8D78_2838 [Arthrobacter oryzae]|uniref:Uncharacterized protein n=1 Tax=Arthrobacter oryzae TaxID=409290 RepID=A0A495EPR7_9MICC|nr:hypothetical protein C8D78_2838 [Arthrobacter oryzae]
MAGKVTPGDPLGVPAFGGPLTQERRLFGSTWSSQQCLSPPVTPASTLRNTATRRVPVPVPQGKNRQANHPAATDTR